MVEKINRVRITCPKGIEPVELNRCCERLYALSKKSEWDSSKYGRILDRICAQIRKPDPHEGCVEFFKILEIKNEHLYDLSGEMFNVKRCDAARFLNENTVSIEKDYALVDLEGYLRSCGEHKRKRRNKMDHGTRYRIYHHPFIRNFLAPYISKSKVYGNSQNGLGLVVTGYNMSTGSGDSLDIKLKDDGKEFAGFTGKEYVLLMAFWSVFEETEGRISMSALWETIHGSRWSCQNIKYKESFFDECKALIAKVNSIASLFGSVKWNEQDVPPSMLFGMIMEADGFYEVKTEGVGGSIGKMRKVHDCDKVKFSMTMPELLSNSGKSVLPIPAELLTTKDLNIYLAYRVLRKIKNVDKAASVILSETIAGLFGDEWSRKSAKHYMENLKEAGYIKGYKMTRRGIEFDASENKTEKKENENE